MPRPLRLDFQGAIHHVRVRGRGSIFFEAAVLDRYPRDCWTNAPHVREFLGLLALPLAECGARLFGYCVTPSVGWLLLQTWGVPLHRFMQRVCGPFSRHLRAHGVRGDSGHPFAGRYESRVIAPEYLPHALRRVHAGAIIAGLRRPGVAYPFSSEQAYVGGRAHVPLDVGLVQASLAAKGFVGLRGYREFMQQAETSYVAHLLDKGSPLDVRIVGSRAFVVQALDRAAHPPAVPGKEQLIAGVAELMRKSPADIFSATHVGVLGRSLVAWYGLRAGAATLSEIGVWFHVSAATLGRGIRYYRAEAPAYFEALGLPGLSIKPGPEYLGREDDDV
jgi:hypothetical protein